MLGGRTQGPYLPSRVSRAGAPQRSRRPGCTEAHGSAAPSPEPCCGPWVPGRQPRARPSGFGPGRLNPSPPRVRAFLPRASQAGPLEGHSGVPVSLPRCTDRLQRFRGSGTGVPPAAGTSTGRWGGWNAGGRAGGRVPSSPAPMGREAGAGALCRSDSRAATRAREEEPGPPWRPGSRLQHPLSRQRLGTSRHKGGASGSSALPAPETVATHRQKPENLKTWTTNQKLGDS